MGLLHHLVKHFVGELRREPVLGQRSRHGKQGDTHASLRVLRAACIGPRSARGAAPSLRRGGKDRDRRQNTIAQPHRARALHRHIRRGALHTNCTRAVQRSRARAPPPREALPVPVFRIRRPPPRPLHRSPLQLHQIAHLGAPLPFPLAHTPAPTPTPARLRSRPRRAHATPRPPPLKPPAPARALAAPPRCRTAARASAPEARRGRRPW